MPHAVKTVRTGQEKANRVAPLNILQGLRLSLIVVASAFALWLTTVFIPLELVSMRNMALTPKDRLDAESGIRSSLIQIVGGVVLLWGLFFTSRTLGLTREGHLTDRYSKAIEQLGDKNADVRIGGIFALERIVRDSPSDRQTIIEVLSTFVREHTRDGLRKPIKDEVTADVQAALTVLGRRPGPDADSRCLNFNFSGLNGADLMHGDFRNAIFNYSSLHGAMFAQSMLDGAGLAFCVAEKAAFTKSRARGAAFVNAVYRNGWFLAADLTNADFYGCDLSGSDFGRRYAEDGDPPLPPAILTNAGFTHAKLTRTNLRGVDLRTVQGLTQEQLADAITDVNTQLPHRWRTERE